MSKERELLAHALDRLKHINFEDDHLTNDLIQTIQKYLAQPEQEPVVWCQMVEGKVQDLLTSFEMKDWLYDKSWMPLYTTPPKREPLSDGTTADMWHANKKATHADSYWAGVYDAEKAHGITGVYDETL